MPLIKPSLESQANRYGAFGAMILFGLLAITIAVAAAEMLGLARISEFSESMKQALSPTVRSAATQPYHYDASPMEQYFIDNSEKLGLNNTSSTATCPLVFDDTSPVYDELRSYFEELEAYNRLVKDFEPITYDLRDRIQLGETNMEQVCSATQIHPEGLSGVFKSNISSSNHAGRMEPILPVMRDHRICDNIGSYLMSMEYLVHDFYSMCMRLKKTSRTVFIDMGASLQFHGSADSSPAVYINRIFRKFGFKFDHIYAYEITQTAPSKAFESVPNELMNSFHWINVGVDPTPGAKLNPFTILVEHFNEDDFIGTCL